MRFLHRCWGFAIPLMLLIAATPILFLFHVRDSLIVLIVDGGTLLVVTGTMLYIVLRDPRGRWPHLSIGSRLTKFITMQR